ncbi:MAG: hypothetical protein AB8G05_17570 [Oligoflexales bacterium]
MITYYYYFIKYGLLACKPTTKINLDWWAFFACFQHLAWNSNHRSFYPPLSLWEVVIGKRMGIISTVSVRILCFFLYFPILMILPWVALFLGREGRQLLFGKPISFFDRYIKTQLDQTSLGLLNSILDLTHLVHNPGSIQLVNKLGFERKCQQRGLPCITSFTASSPIQIGDKVWCKPKWGAGLIQVSF